MRPTSSISTSRVREFFFRGYVWQHGDGKKEELAETAEAPQSPQSPDGPDEMALARGNQVRLRAEASSAVRSEEAREAPESSDAPQAAPGTVGVLMVRVFDGGDDGASCCTLGHRVDQDRCGHIPHAFGGRDDGAATAVVFSETAVGAERGEAAAAGAERGEAAAVGTERGEAAAAGAERGEAAAGDRARRGGGGGGRDAPLGAALALVVILLDRGAIAHRTLELHIDGDWRGSGVGGLGPRRGGRRRGGPFATEVRQVAQ